MASTYSPSLRIELIGAGEQAGTWNTTTNTNLGTLIEAAIAGYVSVSVTSANQAFTALDGAPDQARNAVIALTTTTSAAFAVYAPPQEKTYVIYNTTAYTATVYNSTVLGNTTAAGTGVAVAAGGKVAMFSDGTNFRTTDAASFSGVLPVVNGGTGVTSSTGTGSVALNTAPAFAGVPTAPTAAFGTSTTQLATTAFVQAALQALHPVGSIYTATVSTNPNTLFGFGTWSAFGAGRVLIGNGGGFSAGAEGGNADATLVSHSHTLSSGTFSGSTSTASLTGTFKAGKPGAASGIVTYNGLTGNSGSGDQFSASQYSIDASHSHSFSGSLTGATSTEGSSATNANLQPYIVVYMWLRTA